MRFAFIQKMEMDAEEAYPVVFMCRMLDVSRAGYYEWKQRPLSATAERRERLKAMIKTIFQVNHGAYGYRRVHAAVARVGEQVSDEFVRQLMRELGLVACQPQPWRPTTTEGDEQHRIPDLLCRDFDAEAPGVKLVGDITYVPTRQGWLYLATVIDCYSKVVVGWSMADHYKTPLIASALDMAANNIELADGCVFHSDRGSNLVRVRTKLESMGMRQSVGRTGVCWDNAMAESFFSALKNEWINRTTFATRAEARQAIAQYIGGFHNRRRLHQGLAIRFR